MRACFLFYCQVSPRRMTPRESFILCLVCFGGKPAWVVLALRARNRAITDSFQMPLPIPGSVYQVIKPEEIFIIRIFQLQFSGCRTCPCSVLLNDVWRCFKALRGEMGHMFTQFTALSIFSISMREKIYANSTASLFRPKLGC